MHVRVINMRAKVPEGHVVVVNTTSKSAEIWSRGLSPFFLGPVELYNGLVAENVENAWQYAKVYACHTGGPDTPDPLAPTDAYFAWARTGWARKDAVRYPMGRGAKPKYSLWNGERLGYIEARRRIYCPIYASAVENTPAFAQLQRLYAECMESGRTLVLRDYDGYDAKNSTFAEILANPARKMGHAFVLAMMLTGDRAWIQHNDS